MSRDRLEIEQILENGLQILKERPELADMSLSDVVDELDGTDQIIRDRWGVTAYIVCRRILEWDIKSVVDYLSNVDARELTCEYIGYLLQNKYKIALEEIILEADQQGVFSEIVRYVSTNLRFIPSISGSNVSRILSMLEKYVEHGSYSTFVSNYAIGIASCDGYKIVMDAMGDLGSAVQYHLLSNLGRYWFEKDASAAGDAIQRLLNYKSIWSKKAAIDYWERAVQCDISFFEKYYSQVESFRMESDELWQQMIPVFVIYTSLVSQADKACFEYCSALECLRKIPSDTVEAKVCYLRSIEFTKVLAEEHRDIYRDILGTSFDQSNQALDCLDYFWYIQINSGNIADVLQDMALCFCSNKYRTKYYHFFEQINSTKSAIAKHISLATEMALEYMLKDSLDEMFFGLGLFLSNGSIEKLYLTKKEQFSEFSGLLSDAQTIRVMKILLYFAVDDLQKCRAAFQLLSLSKGKNDSYTEFCLKEVYGDYPSTLHEVATHYKESDIRSQAELARKVNDAYETAATECTKASEIMDLMPSWEHQLIYRKAQNEHSKQIRKMANEKSFFARYFQSQTLKYGSRSGHIVRGAKKEKFYQVTPFQRFEKKMEIAAGYVNDPVDYELRRRSFFSEVIPDETDN